MRATHFALLSLSIPTISGHYEFSKLSLNGGAKSKPWQYIRNITMGVEIGYEDNHVPQYDVYDENIRCGRNASITGPGVETLTVNAGDELQFWSTRRDHYEDTNEEGDYQIHHPGLGQAYLSRTSEDMELESYPGDGDWFKIGSIDPLNDTYWPLLNTYSMNFTIPATTPPGKYLMRVEHIYFISLQFNHTQFYVNCAHLNIVGRGGGNPSPTVKFPGAYDAWDRSIWVPWYIPDLKNLSAYVPPGPAVWRG